MNREQWLEDAIKELRPVFKSRGVALSKRPLKVSVGWPSGAGPKSNTIGQCWSSSNTKNNTNHIFVSPVIEEPITVLSVLVHEIIHSIDDCKSGHKGEFKKLATKVGLTGRMTESVAGDELKEELKPIIKRLGKYPHSAILMDVEDEDDGEKKPRKTRMRKVICADPEEGDKYTIRTTTKWIEAWGCPICPCHRAVMVVDEPEEEEEEEESE